MNHTNEALVTREEQEVSQLTAKLVAISGKLTKTNGELSDEEGKLATLTKDYNESCRKLALGENADPFSQKREIEMCSAKIVGLRALIAELRNQELPLSHAHYAIATKITDQKEVAEIVRLEEDQKSKFAAAEQARVAFDLAASEDFQARARLQSARRARELKEQRRAKGIA